MRTKLVSGFLAASAMSALVGLAAPASASGADEVGTFRYTGLTMSCSAQVDGQKMDVWLYQSDEYEDAFAVWFDGESLEDTSPPDVPQFRFGQKIDGTTVTGGKTLHVRGKINPTGKTKTLHEEHATRAGGKKFYEVVDSTQRVLNPKLRFTYGDVSGKLTCDDARSFVTKVTRTAVS